jgi:hypothetical protein
MSVADKLKKKITGSSSPGPAEPILPLPPRKPSEMPEPKPDQKTAAVSPGTPAKTPKARKCCKSVRKGPHEQGCPNVNEKAREALDGKEASV